MMTPEDQIRKRKYLQKCIFHGLTNSNDGFDSQSISHFSEQQFEIILARVKEVKAIGIYGMETWRDGEFWSVDTFESYDTYPQDPMWYEAAFKKFKDTGEKFMYSASFYVPGNYLNFEEY